MRHRWLVVPLIALALGLLPASVVAAPKSDTIQVRVEPQATLVDGSIDVTVRVKCDPFGEHFESNITVTQDDQRIFAQPGLPIVQCDGEWHEYTVRATPFDGSFHRGRAFASAFVSRLDPVTGETRQGQDFRTIRVR
jgi:hypothetical protein